MYVKVPYVGPVDNSAQKKDAIVDSIIIIITIIINFCKREDVPFHSPLLEYSEAREVWYCSSAMGLCLHLELLK